MSCTLLDAGERANYLKRIKCKQSTRIIGCLCKYIYIYTRTHLRWLCQSFSFFTNPKAVGTSPLTSSRLSISIPTAQPPSNMQYDDVISIAHSCQHRIKRRVQPPGKVTDGGWLLAPSLSIGLISSFEK